ncbi:FxsA family protein [Candidatus Sumerlaeota bacterium]|nr:FxsA family protein [Candidatus Sumerlaeota bacterium]
MNFLFKLILLFTLVPLIELALLIKLAQWTSLTTTLLLVIATGILGGILAKYEGIAVWRRLWLNLQQGIMPTDELIEGLLIFIAGALLITPGMLTDLTGFLILIPLTRTMLRNWIKQKIQRAINQNRINIYFSGPP